MDWFRWWHGTVTDPKFQWVARRSGQSLAAVIAVWAALLECASTATQGNADATRGNVASFDCNDWDVALNLEDGSVLKIFTAMEQKTLIEEKKIVAWEKRQPKREDTGNPNTGALSSTERSRLRREKLKREATECNDVQRDATLGNDREEESREEKKETKAEARAARLPDDWVPDSDDVTFCRTERPDLNISSVADQFRDYWVAQPGAKGRKLDWRATWRNWVRNQKRGYQNGQQGTSKGLVL
jgi:hypothetical protein